MRPGEEPIVEQDEIYGPSQPSAVWTDLEVAARVLRWVACGSAALWLVTVFSGLWFAWSQNSELGATGLPSGAGRIAFTITSALSGSWGYLLVATLAYAATVFLAGGSERS